MKKRNNPKETYQLKRLATEVNCKADFVQDILPNDRKGNGIREMRSYIRERIKTDHSQYKQENQVMNEKQVKMENEVSMRSSKVNFKPKQQEILCQEARLSQLEVKMDLLLQKKLRNLNKSKKKGSLGNLEGEMIELVTDLQSIGNNDNPESGDIQLTSKKIKMLQKLLAQNSTQSQIMKKHYLSKLTKLTNRIDLTQSTKSLYREANSPLMRRAQYTHGKSFQHQSSNQKSYKKPQKNAYKIFKHKDVFFNADRHKQPLPRSTYNREYLICGISPTESFIPKDSHCVGNPLAKQQLITSYRQKFRGKSTQRTNYKQLDAYKDKYRNPAIRFGLQRNQQTKYGQGYGAGESVWRRGELNCASYLKGQLLSESRRQFLDSRPVVRACIKHENLQKLKYIFKREMQV